MCTCTVKWLQCVPLHQIMIVTSQDRIKLNPQETFQSIKPIGSPSINNTLNSEQILTHWDPISKQILAKGLSLIHFKIS